MPKKWLKDAKKDLKNLGKEATNLNSKIQDLILMLDLAESEQIEIESWKEKLLAEINKASNLYILIKDLSNLKHDIFRNLPEEQFHECVKVEIKNKAGKKIS